MTKTYLTVIDHLKIFERAFFPVLTERFNFYGLGELEYRIPGTRPRYEHGVYISDHWGNKMDPDTWTRILGDQDAGPMDDVWFVDDSEKKLAGLMGSDAKVKKHLVLFGEGARNSGIYEISSLDSMLRLV